MDDANIFHDHLDVCRQCREQPFNLCPIGEKALKAAIDELDGLDALKVPQDKKSQMPG